MRPVFTRKAALAFALLWFIFVGTLAWQSWPHVPLDMANDANTSVALAAAKRTNVLVHLGLAIVPPLIAYLIGLIVMRMRARP